MSSRAKSAANAVVIGGARGIGRAVASHLAAQEWIGEVLVADVLADQAEEASEQIRRDGTAARSVAVDLRDAASIRQLAESESDARYLAVAGGIFDSCPSLAAEPEMFERIFAVNTFGTYEAVRLFAGNMVASGGGAIVAVASIAARLPRFKQAAYCASKAAVRQALRVLALELAGSGVRINCVSPGPTDTEMMRRMSSDHPNVDDLANGSLESFRPRIPRGVVARPSDVAAATTFLLSPAAAHITLQDLVVDGGELLGA